MKKIITFCCLLMLMSCSMTQHKTEKIEGYKMITTIGDLEKKVFSPSVFESKGLINLRNDIEVYATQDSIAIPKASGINLFKKKPKKSYLKLSLVNGFLLIDQLNAESSKLSDYIFENPETRIITEISVFLNSNEEQNILNANALFLNKTTEGIYRVKTVSNVGIDYVSLSQDNIFDFKSEKFCIKKSQYDEKIISIGKDCSTVKKKKAKKTRYDRL